MSFANKVVLITGASSGIGATTAIRFTKEGADVAIVGRNETKLKKVEEECERNGRTPLVINADIGNEGDVERIVRDTIARFGKLDVLVNNAGMGTLGSLSDGKLVEAYDTIMRVNVRAVIHLTITTLLTPYLKASKGNIINVSSIAGKKIRVPDYMAYNISKAALDHFTRGAALELSQFGVRVNGVSPGPVRTDFFDNSGLAVTADSLGAKLPLKRSSESEEITEVILYLAGDKARGITGSDYVCDNGALLNFH